MIDGIDELIEFIKPLKQFQINQKKRKIRSKSCPWQEDEDDDRDSLRKAMGMNRLRRRASRKFRQMGIK